VTTRTQRAMNVVLALAVPATGLAYLVSGVSLPPSGFGVAMMLVFGVLWFTATAARGAIARPRGEVATGTSRVVQDMALARRPPTLAHASYVVDVTRPATPWRLPGVFRAAGELLVVVWSVPVVVLVLMVPIGLVLAGVLWIARLILRS